MHRNVTIIMYHYVRELKCSRFPEIKGLDIALFKEQIGYLLKHYTIISVEHLIDAVNNNMPLPPKSCILTFDDAYTDHFMNVFPVLHKHGIKGAFFPPVQTVTKNVVLDVNKIHFILASTQDKKAIITQIFNQLKYYRKQNNLLSDEEYYKKLAVASRFDTAEVMFIKNILQYELEDELRTAVTNYLFTHFLRVEEESFSKELYMSEDQIKCLLQHGMHIGSHGLTHCWLGKSEKVKQQTELEASVKYLLNIGVDEDYLTICYPYGSYNENTLDLLPQYNFKLGFTTEVDIASIGKHDNYCLPRLDTNDVPMNLTAAPNDWFFKG